MTVQELIDILKQYPSDSMVMVDGYEGEVVDLTPEKIYTTKVVLDINSSDYYGPHHPITYPEDIGEYTDPNHDRNYSGKTYVVTEAIVFSRNKKPFGH